MWEEEATSAEEEGQAEQGVKMEVEVERAALKVGLEGLEVQMVMVEAMVAVEILEDL